MSQARPQGDLLGSVLEGAYRITRLVGEGGMGGVYEAVQLRLNKRVAVKVMSRELAANSEALARFRREAEITSHLGHPHLVSVIDFGATDTGEPYLVMEYLDGEDLDHRIRRAGRLPLEVAVEIAKQVASALAAAHDEGIVHRDLKPGNVFLVKLRGEADFVKVLDFGISKIKAARTKLTRASAVMGTPEYMSPEQATGLIEEIDHRADQWALGCIAWEMLSGHPPFVADDMTALFYQVINMDPHPLSRRAPGLPPAVEPVLRRALAKRAMDRYPSIKDFSGAFQAAATGLAREVTPPPMVIPRTALARETLEYSANSLAATASDAVPNPAGGTALLHGTSPADDADVGDDLAEQQAPRRLGRTLAILGVAMALLLVGLIALWPRKPPAGAPFAPSTPSKSPEQVAKPREIVTLPSLPIEPSVPLQEAEPAAPSKTRPAKGATFDGLARSDPHEKSPGGGEGRKPAESPPDFRNTPSAADPFETDHRDGKPGAIPPRSSPFADPFESARPRNKPAQPKPIKTRPQRQIIEEL